MKILSFRLLGETGILASLFIAIGFSSAAFADTKQVFTKNNPVADALFIALSDAPDNKIEDGGKWLQCVNKRGGAVCSINFTPDKHIGSSVLSEGLSTKLLALIEKAESKFDTSVVRVDINYAGEKGDTYLTAIAAPRVQLHCYDEDFGGKGERYGCWITMQPSPSLQ